MQRITLVFTRSIGQDLEKIAHSVIPQTSDKVWQKIIITSMFNPFEGGVFGPTLYVISTEG